MALADAQSRHRATTALVLAIGLLFPTLLVAQQAVIPLQFSFSDPGARSMGFGGAFVALADDATAAFANPAGLTQLLRPEISIETRHWDHVTPYTQSGNVVGTPSGIGIDTAIGLRTAESTYRTTGVSFLSVAWPFEKLSIALYRHVYGDLDFVGETQGLFNGDGDCCRSRFADQQMHSRLNHVNYGLSVAFGIGESLDIGLGLVYADMRISATTTEFLWDEDTVESFFEPNTFLPSRSVLTGEMSVAGDDVSFTMGLLWRMSERWRLGGVYRNGSRHRLHSATFAGQAIDLGVPPGESLGSVKAPVSFPRIAGLGLAYRNPDGNLTLSLQWDHIQYSRIPKSIPLDDQTIDNANELHFGAEYVFLGSTPIIALRVGAWRDPDHQMYATTDDPYTSAMLPRGDDETHVTAGMGVAMNRFQIDFAMDLADRLNTYSLSAIYAF